MSGRKITVLVASIAMILSGAVVVAPQADAKPKAKAPGKVSKARVTAVSTNAAALTWKNPKSKKNQKFSGTVVRYAAGSKAPATVKAGKAAGTVGAKRHAVTIGRLAQNTVYSVSLFSYGGKKLYSKPVVLRLRTRAVPRPPAPKVPPGAVTNVKTSIVNGAAVTSWTPPASTNFGGVIITRNAVVKPNTVKSAAAAATPAFPVRVPVGTNSFSDPSVEPSKTYTYSVQSYDAAGTPSASGSTTAPPTPTDAPADSVSNASSSNVKDTSLTLTWSNPTTTGYGGVRVVRKADSAPTGPTDGAAASYDKPATAATDSNLNAATTYYYAFYSYNQQGIVNSTGPSPLTVKTKFGTAPAVTMLTAVGSSPTSIDLTWTNPTDASYAGVRVVRKAGASAPTSIADGELVKKVVKGDASALSDTGRVAGTRYSYSLFSFNGDDVTNPAPATTLSYPATGPVTNLTANSPGPTAVNLSWTNPTDANFVGVRVVRKPGTTAPTSPTDGVNTTVAKPGTTFADSGLTANTPYSYAVYAYNGDNTYAVKATASVTTAAPPTTVTPPAITGKLTRSDTAAPVAGVVVSAYDTNSEGDDPAATATSQSDGTYVLTGLTANASYDLYFDTRNAPGSLTGYYDPDGIRNVKTSATVVTGNINQTVRPASAIAGKVTSGGAPLAGVRVSANVPSDEDGSYSLGEATTLADGTYRITGLPARSDGYVVCFEGTDAGSNATGYTTVCNANKPWDVSHRYYYGAYLPDGVTSTPTQDTKTATVDASLTVASAIKGTASDANTGAKLADVGVFIYDNTKDYPSLHPLGVTDASGSYTVKGLYPGVSYSVCFGTANVDVNTGYTPECWKDVPWDGVSTPNGTPVSLPTSSGSVTTGVDATLVPAAAVTGSVSGSQAGTKLGNVSVQLYPAGHVQGGNDDDYLTSASTNDTGSFTLRGVDPGSYVVCFDASEATGGDYAGGYSDTCHAGNVAFVAGKTGDIGNTILARAAGFTGKVTAASNGAPLGGVDVSIQYGDPNDFNPSSTYGVETSDDGTYVVPRAPSDSLRVCFGGANVTAGPSLGGYLDSCVSASAASGQLKTVNATLGSAAAVEGKVTESAGGAALSNVSAYVYDSSGNFVGGDATEDDGTYRLAGLQPATGYKVCFDTRSSSGGTSTSGYQAQCSVNKAWDGSSTLPAGSASYTLTAGAVSTVNAALTPGRALNGRVTTSTSAPLAKVRVGLYDADGNFVDSTQTTADGKYAFTSLYAGNYKVCFDAQKASGGSAQFGYLSECFDNVAWNAPDEDDSLYGTSPADGATGTAVLSVGSVTRNVSLDAAGAVSGTVQGEGAGALSNVDLVLFDSSAQVVSYATTGSDGTFRFVGVRSGSYTMCARVDGNDGVGLPTGGYSPRCFQNVAWDGDEQQPPASATAISVSAPGDATAKNLTLLRGGSISGTLKAPEDNSPLDGKVFVYDANQKFVVSVYPDEQGIYTATNLPAGNYYVCFRTADDEGTGRADECWKDVPYDPAADTLPANTTPVSVVATKDHPGIDGTPPRAGGVRGHLTAGGAGVESSVYVYNSVGKRVAEDQSDTDGSYEIDKLLPGSGYKVCFEPFDNAYSPECYDNVSWDGSNTPASGAKSVTITAGNYATVDATFQ